MSAPTNDEGSAATFRAKVTFMKAWKPDSTPSNRDRLELYALHKQAVSGDAPNTVPSSATVAEKTKYQAWKIKRGMSQEQAMAAYIAECDRQIRVYGITRNNGGTDANPQTPNTGSSPSSTQPNGGDEMVPRGIAAIPLLCAAASESRPAYLRRLSRTTLETAWWARQEPLCGSPGTVWSLPETVLLGMASVVEFISLSQALPIPPAVVQSFFWPLHNSFLSVWMLVILLFTIVQGAFSLLSTLLWGSRRTGLSLSAIWRDELQQASAAVNSLCQPHQAISVRLVGLVLLPSTTLIDWFCDGLICPVGGLLASSLVYSMVILVFTWWYWMILTPFLGGILIVAAFWSGFCFALIEMAGV